VLEDRLVERGVSVSTAVRLVRDFPAEQIQAKVEVFDAMSKQRNSGTLRNPAGFLVQSIRDNYVSPAGLEPNVRRHIAVLRPAETRKSARNAARSKVSDISGLYHVEQLPFAEYLTRLSSTERRELEELAITNAHRIPAAGYQRAVATGNDSLASHYRQVIVEQHLRETLPVSAA
jgi:hypothetical protein